MDNLEEIKALLIVVEKLGGHPNLNNIRAVAMARLAELDNLAGNPKDQPKAEQKAHAATITEEARRV